MSRMPSIFVGHGSPMNAVADNAYTKALSAWGKQLLSHHPKAIVCVSAHWQTRGTLVTAANPPRTIHDFGGFPQALYEIQYPAAGAPEVAKRVLELLGTPSGEFTDGLRLGLDESWGLDHGTWSVLLHMIPDASVPVIQLSLNKRLRPDEHWKVGMRLRALRDEGIIIMGSGNIVHAFPDEWIEDAVPQPWATSFDEAIKAALVASDRKVLTEYKELGEQARLSAPTPEHYLPLIYAASVRDKGDGVRFPYEGIQYSSMSMRCVEFL